MSDHLTTDFLPEIVVSDLDYDHLTRLAAAAQYRLPEIATQLSSELERAVVVAEAAMPDDVVRLGSAITFRTNDGPPREGVLVLPVDANISKGLVSILTPVGTALLGLRQGQSISFMALNGHRCRLSVLAVRSPVR